MAGKGRITVLILAIAAFAAAGCSSPVGSIGGDSLNTIAYDNLRVESKKLAFDKDEWFFPTDDYLEVYATSPGGGERLLDPEEYVIYIVKEPEYPDGPDVLVGPVTHSGYQFTAEGEKAIRVEYRQLSFQYPIVVSGSVGNQSSTIIITWD